MSAGEAERASRSTDTSGEPTAVLPETAAELVKLEQLQLALAQAEERARSLHDQYVRALAEVDNVRKRSQRDVESANRYGLEKFAVELLPVKDSLQLAVENAPRADARSLAEGQDATLKLLSKAFEKLGINEINPVGEPFDPMKHEALTAQESNSAEPNSVLQVVQRGYELNGRLLRPARVIVSKAPA
ncbi:MAG TPA: nucleotide exchange factor GrpE [Nitrospiraceae bacterium]|jgi:molecular chaperone GrpE|nr:nucleotide exchange factor GrpE [Nitrospiraceae bacterium]